MSITLGNEPEDLTVLLTPNSRFYTTLVNEDGPWAVGASLELRLGGVVWVANITGDEAYFSATPEQVDSVIHSKITRAKLFYIDAGIDDCWASGEVVARG